jgi:preprotein translocase subunit SecG
MLYIFVISIHVIASLILIAVILLQAGRGGGLSETFGGGSTQTLFGTKTNVFLTRATAASAIIYIITCLTLAVMTSHRGKSLVANERMAMPAQSHQGAPIPDQPADY